MPESVQLLTGPRPRIAAEAGTTTLTYALRTEPSPLTVSLPGEPALLGTLQLVVTNPLPGAVRVSGIGVTLQMGADAAELGTTTEGSGYSVSDTVNWSVTPPSGTITTGPATWLVGPATGDAAVLPGGASIVVELSGIPVNQAVGTTAVSVVERLEDGTRGDTAFEVTKFPYGFFFEGLVATVRSGSELVPVAQVANGTAVTLRWSSSVVQPAAFTVLYTTNEGQRQGTVSTAGEWTSPGLARDTVFVVQVKVTSGGGESLSFALAAAVAVEKGDLALASASVETLRVSGASTLSGGATVGGSLAAGAITASGLAVSGSASASALTVSGQAALSGGARVNGTLEAGTVRASTVAAGTLQSPSGGSPLIRDDNGHTILLKWVGQSGNNLSMQLFMWDNAQRWGGLTLPVLGYKTFIIPHPLRDEKYLVHAALEGPEGAVYYRGEGRLADGRATVRLPDYFEALTREEGRTVQLTNVGGFDRLAVEAADGRCVTDGCFVVVSDDPRSQQAFCWEVKAVRRDAAPLTVEPDRSELGVVRFGAYAVGIEQPPASSRVPAAAAPCAS